MRKDQIRGQGHELHIAWDHSCILEPWKYIYCRVLKITFRVVKPMLQGYVASCEHIFSFMATWKCDCFNSRSCEKTKFVARVKRQGQTRTTHRVSSLHAFWRLENTFTAESWNSRSRVPGLCELIFCILVAWKCDFYRVMKPMLQEFVALCEHICSFMATWKCEF